jgi:hypothetical protein
MASPVIWAVTGQVARVLVWAVWLVAVATLHGHVQGLMHTAACTCSTGATSTLITLDGAVGCLSGTAAELQAMTAAVTRLCRANGRPVAPAAIVSNADNQGTLRLRVCADYACLVICAWVTDRWCHGEIYTNLQHACYQQLVAHLVL